MTTFSQWMRGEGRVSASDLVLPEAARGFQGDRAGFPSRLSACLIDLGLVILVMLGIWVAFWLLQLIFTPGVDAEPPRAATLVVWGYFLMSFYWMASWATSGRSVGAWAMGLRVVNRKGDKLSWPLALLRAAFSVGFPFGLLWALFSKRNRSLQDIALRTIVIYDWAVRPPVLQLLSRETPSAP